MEYRMLAVGVAIVAAAGCAGAPVRCPVMGNAAALAGVWDGQFSSQQTGRTGTIHFELEAGQDSAYGDVLLAFEQWTQAGRLLGEQRRPQGRLPELIRVSFVFVANGIVQGTLEPYRDPLCDCMLTTVFEGRLNGDVIEGTYETRHEEGGTVAEGTWNVKRSSAELYTRVHGDHAGVRGQ